VIEVSTNSSKAQTVNKHRKMTEKRLQNIALYYCQRYVISQAKLVDYLKKRVYREVKASDARQEFFDLIPELAMKMADFGYVNDREAASAKLRLALRSGYAATRAVYKASRSSMVKDDEVKQELESAVEDALPGIAIDDIEAPESVLAMASAALERSKRGGFRTGRMDETTARRDIAWLQRRGYSFEVIKKAMGLGELY
jgi:SOS response regulatory protein OraA/RecX